MIVKFVARITQTILLCSLLLSAAWITHAQTDGIFAEFNTSMGSYTCRIEYAKAPLASANFIGLATGDRPWLDLTTGLVKTTPYFDGQTFHRVIAGFMNQGGSPNGQGTDGPGYSFVDEFDPSLRHDGFGVLSSANSGPDSNGSQFFTTVAATPWLDDVHTVFGKLVGGSNVVYAINNVATDGPPPVGKYKPLTNVVLNSVTIVRVGALAQAFDIDAQGLPDVTPLMASIAKATSSVSLTYSNQLNADNRLFSSTNLADWSGGTLGIEVESPVTNQVVLPMSFDEEFFRMAQVQYNDTLHVPKNVLGTTVTLDLGVDGTIMLSFDNAEGGTYLWTYGSPEVEDAGSITSYNWTQDPYRGRLRPITYTGIIPMDLHMDYDSETNGTFKGTAYPNYPSSTGSFGISGSFTSP